MLGSGWSLLQNAYESWGRPISLLLGFSTVYICFYWTCVPKRPLLVTGRHFASFLEKNCPIIKEKFYPTLWCVEGHLQTLVRAIVKSRPPVTYRNERIQTADGGQISLDWLDNVCSQGYADSASRSTVLILPGLTGSSKETYIFHMVQQVVRQGYRAVVFNNRGFGGAELLTPRTFCAADTEDLETVIRHVKSLYPQAPLLAVGVSMGGMILLNYLAKTGPKSEVFSALTLSVTWNMMESCLSLEKTLNHFLFNSYLTSNLRSTINRHRLMVESKVDVDYVLKSRTIREFDERYTSVMFGYNTCQEYYHDGSPYYKLPDIRVPLLCLNAADDPFCPSHTIPINLAKSLPNVALLVTSHGGHIGFLEGLFPWHENYMDRVFAQFIKAVFEHKEDLQVVIQEGTPPLT